MSIQAEMRVHFFDRDFARTEGMTTELLSVFEGSPVRHAGKETQ
jgi:hypothetical protein